jgi:FkbM family methyltransferase
LIKRLAQHLIPEKHYAHLSWYRTHFGLAAALLGYGKLLASGAKTAPVAVPRSTDTVYLRPGTSDEEVFSEVFLAKEYDVDLGAPRFIIDAGAHIGLASLFFARRYPKATIVAIEAEESNFALLCRNVRPLANVHPLRVALWSHQANVGIANPDAATWAFQVAEGSPGRTVPATTVDQVMSMFSADQVDVLKMDIEGAEKEVLSTSAAWIDKTEVLIVELHDRFRPGCTQALDEATKSGKFVRSTSGESVVLTRVR